MGRVIAFIPRHPPACPAATDALDPAENLLLHAMRWWVADMKQGQDPLLRLTRDLADAADAVHSVDQLMRIVTRSAQRPVEVGCPHCPWLSADEQLLLVAASLAHAGETAEAEAALQTGMLSAPGAELAIGPLEGLGEIFADAGLVFRRRALPPAAAGAAWMAASPGLLH